MLILTIDKVLTESDNSENVIILREQQSKLSLPIFLERTEAEALQSALYNKESSGLLSTYDLLRVIIKGFSTMVIRTVIQNCDSSEGKLKFEAKILITDGVSEFEVICFAPDAIAIAILTQTPIYVEESIIEIIGVDLSSEVNEDNQEEEEGQDVSKSEFNNSSDDFEINRILASDESNLMGGEIELVVDQVLSFLLGYQYTVVLNDHQKTRSLPIWVAQTEADVIEKLIDQTAIPETYYLIFRLIEAYSSEITKVIISDRLSSCLRAQLIFQSSNRRFVIECRPSDAIIIALIAQLPIYAKESVF